MVKLQFPLQVVWYEVAFDEKLYRADMEHHNVLLPPGNISAREWIITQETPEPTGDPLSHFESAPFVIVLRYAGIWTWHFSYSKITNRSDLKALNMLVEKIIKFIGRKDL